MSFKLLKDVDQVTVAVTYAARTEEKVVYIFDTLFDCETTITNLSKKTGISRATLHHWKRGGYVNDQLRLTIAFKEVKKIARGV